MITGHEEARREMTEQGWRYLDEKNQTLAEVLQFLGCSLPDLDGFIEQLESEKFGAGKELRERRQKALNAFSKLSGEVEIDDSAYIGHIEWIIMRKREITKGDIARPLIKDGIKKRQGDKNRTRALVEKNISSNLSIKERNKLIIKEYDRLLINGERGIPKQLSKKHPDWPQPKTISNIWNKREK